MDAKLLVSFLGSGFAISPDIICTAQSVAPSRVRVKCPGYVIKSTRREFEEPALQAVRKWRFKPGVRARQEVNVRMSVLMAFRLNK